MSTLRILTYPDHFLLKPTEPLKDIDGQVQQMIDTMAETMYAAPGIGLAAIQVGITVVGFGASATAAVTLAEPVAQWFASLGMRWLSTIASRRL